MNSITVAHTATAPLMSLVMGAWTTFVPNLFAQSAHLTGTTSYSRARRVMLQNATSSLLDADIKPLLLHPRIDDPQEHLTLRDDGTSAGLTPKGIASIATLHLNRPALVEARRRERLYKDLAEARPDLRAALLEDDFHPRFVTSMANITALNMVTGLSSSSDQSLRYMLYANIITCLETYLGDALITTVKSERWLMRKFVETFQGFKDMKFTLAEVFAKYDTIDEIAIREMADVLYHNLAKVAGIYRDTLGIVFPKDMGNLYRAVAVRHDIVHRNGKNKEGVFHVVSSTDVEQLATQVTTFVTALHSQITEVHRQLAEEN